MIHEQRHGDLEKCLVIYPHVVHKVHGTLARDGHVYATATAGNSKRVTLRFRTRQHLLRGHYTLTLRPAHGRSQALTITVR